MNSLYIREQIVNSEYNSEIYSEFKFARQMVNSMPKNETISESNRELIINSPLIS